MNNAFLSIENARTAGKKIGFTASSFDLLHPGHISMLAEARANCDFLVVGLLTDPTISRPDLKHKPVQGTFERFVQIQAIEYIDVLIPFDTEEDLVQMIKMIQPDIRFCGSEYKGTHHTGYDIPGIYTYYNRRDHDYSTTELRQRIAKQEANEAEQPVKEQIWVSSRQKREQLSPGERVLFQDNGCLYGAVVSSKQQNPGKYVFACSINIQSQAPELVNRLSPLIPKTINGFYICDTEQSEIIDKMITNSLGLYIDSETYNAYSII